MDWACKNKIFQAWILMFHQNENDIKQTWYVFGILVYLFWKKQFFKHCQPEKKLILGKNRLGKCGFYYKTSYF